jgi:hypothetical protein
MRRLVAAGVLAIGLAFAGSLPASAVTLISSGNTYGPINSGDIYSASDGRVVPGLGDVAVNGSFTHTYNFTYNAPPSLSAVSFTVDNVNPTNGSGVNIANFTLDWQFNGSSVLGFPTAVGVFLAKALPLTTGSGLYSLILSGNAATADCGAAGVCGGLYSVTMLVNDAAPPPAPLPAAMWLFATALIGGAGAYRLRKKTA